MDKQNLVSTMKEQHKGLQADLMSLTEVLLGGIIVGGLEKFKSDLTGHLSLENETFYVQLLEKMREKGMDTKNTETFIASMNDIAKVVMEFLNKYGDVGFVSENIDEFKQDLQGIIKALNVRIESEEDGVYEEFLII